MADDLMSVVVWKNLLIDGRDYCALSHTADGWLLKGTVIGVLKNERPMLANYEIYCDENWLTHRVQVDRTIGSDVKSLELSVESGGLWRSSGQELRDVHGCEDVDLAVTHPRPILCRSGVSTCKSGAASQSLPLGSSSLSLRFNH